MMHGRYQRAADSEAADDLAHLFAFETRARFFAGDSLALCAGFDVAAGGAGGVLYEADAYPVGIAARLGDVGVVGLCGGAGLSGVTDTLPLAWQFPVEAVAELPFGSLRTVLWVRPSWVVSEERREQGAKRAPFADELEAGLTLRLEKLRDYWPGLTAGYGVYAGVVYREQVDLSFWGVILGLGLWGG